MPSESELIAIYRDAVRPLYAFVARRTGGDRELSEDVVQEAWLRAVADWDRRGFPDRPLAWLQRVARNLMASHYRRRRPEIIESLPPDLDGDAAAGSPAVAAAIQWALAALPPDQRVIVEASYFEGKANRDIARDTGLSERAVEGRLRRSRKILRRRLAPYYDPKGADT